MRCFSLVFERLVRVGLLFGVLVLVLVNRCCRRLVSGVLVRVFMDGFGNV